MTNSGGDLIDAKRDPRRQPLAKELETSNAEKPIEDDSTLLQPARGEKIISEGNAKSDHPGNGLNLKEDSESLRSPRLSFSPRETKNTRPTDPSRATKISNPLLAPSPARQTSHATDLHESPSISSSPVSHASPNHPISTQLRRTAADALAVMSQVPVQKYPFLSKSVATPSVFSMTSEKASPTKREGTSAAYSPLKTMTNAAERITNSWPVQEEKSISVISPLKRKELQYSTGVQRKHIPVDLSARLVNDSEHEVIYKKGEGKVLVRHGMRPIPSFEPVQHPAPDNQKFRVKLYWTEARRANVNKTRWVKALDSFEMTLEGNETLIIQASTLSGVAFNFERQKKFYLFPTQNALPEDRLAGSILEVGGDDKEAFRLRSLFERRFGAMKVNKAESDFFVTNEKAFERANLASLPPQVASQPDGQTLDSSEGHDDSVIEHLKKLNAAAAVHQQARQVTGPVCGEGDIVKDKTKQARGEEESSSPVLGTAVQSLKSTSDRRENTSSDDRISKPELSKVLRTSIASAAMQRQEKAFIMRSDAKTSNPRTKLPSKKPTSSRLLMRAVEVDVAELHASKRSYSCHVAKSSNEPLALVDVPSSSPTTAIHKLPSQDEQTLYYNSGEPMRKNDLVIRIRDSATMVNGNNKQDRLDVYDGPFRVSRLAPLQTTSKPSKSSELGLAVPQGNTMLTEIEAMKEIKVKLHFPRGSVADPWTKLERLRPVYRIDPNVPEAADAKMCYYWPKSEGRQRVIKNTLLVDEENGEDDSSADAGGICRLQKGVFVKVDHVAPEPLEGDKVYEIARLRNKSITRHSRKDFPDELMDDPIIVRYLEGGGTVAESEVLVVKYLVHWAGWPSEDDTYERAQDNIPRSIIDEYQAFAPDVEIEDAPERPPKKQKPGVKAVKCLVHTQ
ncbi:hypothetical protein MMC13_000921 [Lambiella insularis]|nr:hypothetical protein [Lambiella insularis]